MLLERDELRLLAEIGFFAAQHGDVPRAERIFKGLELAQPQGAAAYAGRALAYLSVKRVDEALRMLDRGLTLAHPDGHAELHAIRGLALQLAGRGSESAKALARAGPLPLARVLRGEPAAAPQATP